MENLDFSEEEIQEQLNALGYVNIPKERLREFKRDLDLLIYHEKSKSSSSAEWSSTKSHGTSCKSPPAFTKEKVQIPSATSKYNYVYGGNSPADQHRQVLTSTFNDENCDSLNLMPGDSYIKHTVVPRYIRSSTAPNRLEVLNESSDIDPSALAASEPVRPRQPLQTTTKPALKRKVLSESVRPQEHLQTTTKPALKRKVLRKRQGHTLVCDESTHSEDSVSELEEHLSHLHVSPDEQHPLYTESEETSSYSDRNSSGTEELRSAFQIYIKGMTRSRSENDLRPRLKSFIRPVMDHPHTRNFKKSDPVAKYFQYKQEWEMFKPPGEKRRKELHWAIREQLEYQPPPPRPQRTYIPNTYVVPTEKKRSALRWEIRHDLANGIVPARVTYT